MSINNTDIMCDSPAVRNNLECQPYDSPSNWKSPCIEQKLIASDTCDSPAGWNLPEIQSGLLHTPRHVSEHLQWLTDEGQDLYSKRKSTVDVFKREETSIKLAMKQICKRVSNTVVVIDLGAGLSNKTISMFHYLVKGFPERRICYIPVDVNDIIMEWDTHLSSEHPAINEHIVKIKPVLMDMLEAVNKTDELLAGTGCEDWEIVYSLFGPMSTILHNTYFVDLVKTIQKVLKPRGNGGFIFSYLPSHDGIEDRINEEYYSKLDMSAIMKCVLLGLNKVVGTKVDPEKFTYEKKFLNDNITPGVEGKWSGFAIFAKAKEDMEFFCKKLQMPVHIKSGQQIRLSEDIVKAHYYEDLYIRSLAEKSHMFIDGVWQEPSQLISCVYITVADLRKCGASESLCINSRNSPRTS